MTFISTGKFSDRSNQLPIPHGIWASENNGIENTNHPGIIINNKFIFNNSVVTVLSAYDNAVRIECAPLIKIIIVRY